LLSETGEHTVFLHLIFYFCMRKKIWRTLTTIFLPVVVFAGCSLTSKENPVKKPEAPKTLMAQLRSTQDQGNAIADVRVVKVPSGGIKFIVNAKNLSEGEHSFDIHENESCADNGNAAGEHYDPENTEAETGEYIGKLPDLVAGEDGIATLQVIRKDLSLFNGQYPVYNHAVIIHERNDHPENPGDSIACGVMK
jgi:Cu-Zn family superoxide dismutase